MLVKTRVGTEYIDHQLGVSFGDKLFEVLKKCKGVSKVNDDFVRHIGLSEVIKNNTGMNVIVNILINYEDSFMASPTIDKNNIINQQYKRWFMSNTTANNLLEDKTPIKGVVNLKDGTVSGDYSKIPINIYIGSLLLSSNSRYTTRELCAVLLHAIGHALVYFEMLGKILKTNYIIADGTERLFNCQDKVKKLSIAKEIEDSLSIKLEDRDKVTTADKTSVCLLLLSEVVKESENEMGYSIYDSRGFEQLADAYAVRQGYGKDLASALIKITGDDTTYLHPSVNLLWNIIKLSSVTMLMVFGGPFIQAYLGMILLLSGGNPFRATYDSLPDRIRKINNQLNDALKDKSITNERKVGILEDKLMLEKSLKSMYDNLGVWETMWKWVFYPFTRKQINLISVNNNLENMVNNPLYANSAKLDLINKRVI